MQCEICKEKFGFQPHPIFLGNINSKIVQISQAPSTTVHETLKPFTDQSGKKLKNILLNDINQLKNKERDNTLFYFVFKKI